MKLEKRRRYDMTGRAAKAEATKERIRASAMELYCERPIDDFTLDDVAERAGTTVQTVLRDFGNKENVIFESLLELGRRGVMLKPTPPGDVAAAVAAFHEIYEGMGDLVMRRLSDEERHPALKPILDDGRRHHREGVATAFAPQLARLRGAARAQLLNALIVATDVYVWKLLRRDFGLGRAAAEAIVRKIINGVINGETRDGTDTVAELVGRRKPAS
jgi:AcrR family transcriptional regulator